MAAAGKFGANAHGGEHMGLRHLAGGAGRARGNGDAFEIEIHQQGFG